MRLRFVLLIHLIAQILIRAERDLCSSSSTGGAIIRVGGGGRCRWGLLLVVVAGRLNGCFVVVAYPSWGTDVEYLDTGKGRSVSTNLLSDSPWQGRSVGSGPAGGHGGRPLGTAYSGRQPGGNPSSPYGVLGRVSVCRLYSAVVRLTLCMSRGDGSG